jgi:hypothetical protein
MVEVWKIMEEYENLYSIHFENQKIDLLKANQLNEQIDLKKFANHFLTKSIE